MADLNQELQTRLQALDHELEEGDITHKGYEKRRTLLLSQFLGPEYSAQLQNDVQPRASADTEHDGAADRHASFAALSSAAAPPTLDLPRPDSYYGDPGAPAAAPAPYAEALPGTSTMASAPYAASPAGTSTMGSAQQYMAYPPSQVGRFQEKQLGIRTSSLLQQQPPSRNSETFLTRPQTPESYSYSREGTMMDSNFAFNPDTQPGYDGYGTPGEASRRSTMLDVHQGYFSDFTGQQMQDQRDSYGGPSRYSVGDAFSPTAAIPPPMMHPADLPAGVVETQLPLEPRDLPFDVYDGHNTNVQMSKFDNIGAVLRHRGRAQPRQTAFWVLDAKGKETASITWDKVASRAEKVAKVIRDKSNLYRGDRVALVYRDVEVIEFVVALLGCFIAGVVAVPINSVDDYQKLTLLLTTTQAHLALTTDNNLKTFHRDISQNRLKWPSGVEWWKTNEFGSHHPKKQDDTPALQVPEVAYIEFSRAPTGDLRGVVLSHRTIMHQMACISAMVTTIPTGHDNADTFSSTLRDKNGKFIAPPPRSSPTEVILSYLDPRESAGLILSVLFSVYGGHTTVWLESATMETPGLYAHLITKYKTTIMVSDYPGLKRAAYNYQQDPLATRNYKKNTEPNFAPVKICFIDTLTVDCEFHEILGDRWFRPMRNPRARELIAPMLCLPEHGGMIISVRDWLGGEERMGCPLSIEEEDPYDEDKKIEESGAPNGYSSLIGGGGAANTKKNKQKKGRNELTEILLDKEALKMNEAVVLAIGEEASKRANEPGTMRVGAFGYPIPDATLAVVDPETNLLCSPYSIGEIWVDSPSLSGGFWQLQKHTESIFHARPYRFVEGSPTPQLLELEFLRTGLLGCVVQGKIFVLGLYEDRIRQRVEWVEHGVLEAEHRYFFVQHLVTSIMKSVPKIYDCSAFDSHVNGEYLPIILIETQAASTAPTNPGGPPQQLDIPFLDSLSERCMEVLYQEHHLRVYCVMITAPNTLPRIIKNGRREIGNMLCRREFDNGSLPCVHVKFGIERSVQNIALGDDPAGGMWSYDASMARQNYLMLQDKQYSGVDHREVVIDDRTSTPLNKFSNIHDLMQWRVSRQPDELAYCTVDGRGKEGKGVNWKKFDQKVAGVAMYLKNKVKIQAGDHLLLMYTHSEEFVYAIHACFVLGAVAIPMAPIDQNRLNEDAPALLHILSDFKVKAILVNADVDHMLKVKQVSQHIKQSAAILKITVPATYNTTKPPKQSSGCRDLKLTIRPAWVQAGFPVLVWTYWTPDQRRIAVQLGHSQIMALCKVQKETCQMTSTRPVLGCVRSTIGLGFVHTCVMGVFLAAPTYLVSPVDFAQNPNILFQTLARYKIKDAYATSQMLDHAIARGAGKTMPLHELKNLMIATDGRPRVDVYQRVRMHFQPASLDKTAINTVYSHVLNPMVASRSYMCIEPIELHLDVNALRRGLILPVDPDLEPNSLLVQDSGMVPVSTQIAIVNPETNQLCLVGEYGEIWVQSEANAHSFYGSKERLDAERFNGRTVDGDPNVRYVRTGDLGFLHNVTRPIGPNGASVDMQVLFVLGSIGDTFEVNGLNHFSMDIEQSVERCHRNILPGGWYVQVLTQLGYAIADTVHSAVFQAGGLVVVVVEIFRRNFLASMVPVIVNAVLNEHQLVIDIVAFVIKGDFHRSRLGEKQRGKILAGWVTRKMRTIAQYSIRDPNGADNQITEEPVGRASTSTFMRNSIGGPGSMKSPSLHGAGSTLGMTAQMNHLQMQMNAQELAAQSQFAAAPADSLGHASYQPSIPGMSPGPFHNGNDITPTEERMRFPPHLEEHAPLNYLPVDRAGVFDDNPGVGTEYVQPQDFNYLPQQQYAAPSAPLPNILRAGPMEERGYAPEPTFYSYQDQEAADDQQGDGRWQTQDSDYGYGGGGGGGGLRVANRDSGDSNDSWTKDALNGLNFAGSQARR
ncbi:acetyl-CoA synthetase-like protein [Dothidotthia symphoricarpi CBS 119687]|uniref:Acetyl-CoA synthetase-like protein n=1 Tax=Dothidotthia symphoricarpi CBS 119687 TaxID=1392245 RepID=A0A6A6A285_9PLEO|nr:acetyl-CoA synthetase-like protein [Dothidotthia symphoricarpi CBS 119687]KAF2124691.1 acetyl-CoA synthetase-like protein [Dothidotthia symphoricarpi CBS 119687]